MCGSRRYSTMLRDREGEGINGKTRQLPKLVEFMINNNIIDLQFGSRQMIHHYCLNDHPSYKVSQPLSLSLSLFL